jgi:hypothetical protein
MFAMQFEVCPHGREARWVVRLGIVLRRLPGQGTSAARLGRRRTRCPTGRPGGPGLGQRPIYRRADLLAMATVIGPVLTRTGGYAFDVWTPEQGLSPGHVYSRIEDAY